MDSTRPEVGSNPSANTFEDENEAVDTNDLSSRKHSKKEWEDQRSRIADLYESGTLQNLTNVMKEDYQFEATPKQFKDRIKKWGLKKNIQPDEMEAMIRKQQQRLQEENKQTAFELRGRPVNQEKIDRYKRDHPIKDHVEIYKTTGGAVTPPDINYHTPVDTGSVLEEPLGSEPVSMPVPNPAGGTDMSNSQQSQTNPYTSMGSGQSFTQVNSGTPEQTYNLFGHFQPPPSQYMYSFGGSLSVPNQPFSAGSHVPPHNTPTPLASPPQAPQSFGQGAPQGYAFQYSTCTGRRKALLIGINYFGQRGQLRGCINDVKNMSSFLHENFGYPRENMVILTDDQQDPRSQPTKQNILRAMHWLVKDARLNDSLFFHFSGHGGQIKDLDGDEDDGYDEAVYPVDFRQVGHITDDEMHRIMVATLPQGVRLTALFDSCHSDTALDLPYIYSTQGILREPNLAKEAGQGLLGVIASYSKMDIASSKKEEKKNRKDRKGDKDNKPGKNGEDIQVIASRLMGFFKKATEGDETTKKTAPIQTKTSGADVVMWSCTSVAQSSAEISQAATGAMSWAFITAMRKNPQQSYLQLLNSARDELASKYSMVPQLSCSHPLNTNLLFSM